jgi:hypothetical protein
MNTLIIPAYYANEDLRKMTQQCLLSVGEIDGEILLEVDEHGEGYSKTVNKALQRSKGDILIIGNNDLVFPDNWLVELLFPINLGFDIATCWTSDQQVKVEDRIEVNAKFGSIFAMTREVYENLGGFDEQFKGYFTDTDYRHRALEAGFRIGKNLNLVIMHLAKATYKITDPDDDEFLMAQRLYEAKYGFAE